MLALSARVCGEVGTLAKVLADCAVGMDGALAEFEVEITQAGLPSFLVAGLPGAAVQEARERGRVAIRHAGLSFPTRRMVFSDPLAPAR